MLKRKQEAGRTGQRRWQHAIITLALVFLLALGAGQAVQAQTFDLLYQFKSGPDGAYPIPSLILDSKGNLYGTASADGAYAAGTVFKVSPAGKETVLYSFTGTGGDGAYPSPGPLLRDSAGNLYGTTMNGGSCCGTVFKIDSTGKETVLYKFAGTGGDGSDPQQGVVADSSGNLYGTTYGGGAYGVGTVFKLDSTGNETVLYSFNPSNGTDGYNPSGGSLLWGSGGNLYGTTYLGGTGYYGTVFKVDTTGAESVLCNFDFTDGAIPYGTLVADKAGNLYGTAALGGTYEDGVVFKCDTSGNLTDLYSFSGTGGDGNYPAGGLVRDSAGNLYGATGSGGTGYYGTVFKLDTTGKETILHSFVGTDGFDPYYGLVRYAKGNLFGDTYQGGKYGGGVVFKLQGQTFSLLYQFKPGPGGINPDAGVILDPHGNLYGTTYLDGAAGGTVYKLSANGKETVLYSFTGLSGDGYFPFYGSLVRDSAGNLYGTTSDGGTLDQYCPFGCGTVLKVDSPGKETVLHAFTGTGNDGYMPFAGVTRDPSGNLYGLTPFGGTYGGGVAYELDSTGKETILHSFGIQGDGYNPQAGLIRDSAGDLYGTTASGGSSYNGTVFGLSSSGTETILYNFTGGADGGSPLSGLIRDSAGNLYGTTNMGGASGYGTVFKVTASGTETVLYSFAGGTDGQYPAEGSLVRDKSGNLYGTTPSGGAYGFGIVFRIDTKGNETILHSFAGTDGKGPYGTLVMDSTGALYGTANDGGAYGGGVVFKITP